MKLGNREFALSSGFHRPKDGGACVMELAGVKWLMQHGWSLTDAWDQLTDSPPCTDPLVYRNAQTVNDRLSDEGLSRLELRVDRLMSCHTPADAMSARRVRVRVACWAARSVLHLVDEAHRGVALRSVETAEAWLRGEATKEDCAAAYAAATATAAYATASTASAAATSASSSSSAATYATGAAAYAYAADAIAAATVAVSERDDALLDFLDGLLDAWDKAIVEEGCAADEAPMPVQVGGS